MTPTCIPSITSNLDLEELLMTIGAQRAWLTEETYDRARIELALLRMERATGAHRGRPDPEQRARRIRQLQELIAAAAVGHEPPDDDVAEPGMVLTVHYEADDLTETFLMADRESSANVPQPHCAETGRTEARWPFRGFTRVIGRCGCRSAAFRRRAGVGPVVLGCHEDMRPMFPSRLGRHHHSISCHDRSCYDTGSTTIRTHARRSGHQTEVHVLNDRERKTLREVERQFLVENPEFTRSFATRAQRLERRHLDGRVSQDRDRGHGELTDDHRD
jgi:hypothetical protein